MRARLFIKPRPRFDRVFGGQSCDKFFSEKLLKPNLFRKLEILSLSVRLLHILSLVTLKEIKCNFVEHTKSATARRNLNA